MKLADLAKHLPGARLEGDGSVEVNRPRHDSRTVQPGDLYCALAGQNVDGNEFIDAAVRAGAAAVMTARPGVRAAVPVIRVGDDRLALARAAHALYGDPTRRVQLVGFTGTNGKTTCIHLLESMLRAAGFRPGRIGTVGWAFGGEEGTLERTTPEAPDLLERIASMAGRGATHVVMEVTSIAVPMKRIAGFHFRAGVYTNLSQDHLDLHGTMEDYFLAKKGFFDDLSPESVAVANLDDPHGHRILMDTPARRVTFGFGGGADVLGELIEESLRGVTVRVAGVGRGLALHTPLLGGFNAENLLACAAVAREIGLPDEAIARGAETVPQVRGRMERVEVGGGVTAIVDYAHTPEALRKAIEALKPHARGRLIVVFGAGGDRDRGKRPTMGKIAAEGADRVFVTSDNPRGEEPGAIIEEILRGAVGEHVTAIVDRREAIRAALAEARSGDIVLVAGKGHETYQEIGGVKHPFDDREELLAARRERASC